MRIQQSLKSADGLIRNMNMRRSNVKKLIALGIATTLAITTIFGGIMITSSSASAPSAAAIALTGSASMDAVDFNNGEYAGVGIQKAITLHSALDTVDILEGKVESLKVNVRNIGGTDWADWHNGEYAGVGSLEAITLNNSTSGTVEPTNDKVENLKVNFRKTEGADWVDWHNGEYAGF